VQHWQPATLFTPAERALFAYLDALAETDHPPAPVFAALQEHYAPATVVGITLLAAFYFMTAKFLGSMEVETEGPFVGWDVEPRP
jgi:alkylhydroperoxidase family enzyme